MHYDIKDCIIKSENAAKSVKQPNKEIINWINSIPENSIVLDYGCGKFRYTIPLSRKVKKVVAVDSIFQIQRIQRVNSSFDSLINYAKNELNNVEVYNINQSEWINLKYDFILCTNVLSSIPLLDERYNIIKNFTNLLKPNGKVLISTQYRNSYFNSFKNNLNATKFGDGWITKSNLGHSFYGIINLEKLYELCNNCGLIPIEGYRKDGSAYIISKSNSYKNDCTHL